MYLDDEEERLTDWLYGLSPEVRAAQLLVVAPDPDDDPGAVVDWLAENQYGGLFLQWRQLRSRDLLFELGERLREMTDASPPPFICTDEEGGLVSDTAVLITTAPSPAALVARNDVQLTYQTALAMGEKLRALGFNLVFAPSLDINAESRNPVIGTRAYGSTAESVLKHGLATIEGLARTGLIACVKHFPGHGATRMDSHLTLPEVDASLDLLAHRELLPFRAAIDAGIPMIMAAHVSYPALDPTGGPATLSPEILNELLREELGYEGVVISDSMEMEGIASSGDPGSIAIQAIEAGLDLLLYGLDRDMAAVVADRLGWALKHGELSEERVLQSLIRTGRLRQSIVASEEALDDATRDEILDYQHEALLKQVSAEGITLLGGAGPDLPLKWEGKKGLMIVPTAREPRLNVDIAHLKDLVEPLGITVMAVSLAPGEADRQAVVDRIRTSDFRHVIACILARGTLPDEQRRLIDDVVATGYPVILTALLDAQGLADFPSIRTRLATHGFGPLVLEGLVEVLLGRQAPNSGGGTDARA